MIGPVPTPYPGEFVPPPMNPPPEASDAVDSPTQAIGDRQPLELPTERVDLLGQGRGPSPRQTTDGEPPLPDQPLDLPEAPNAAVTFRILKALGNRIQSRVVDRTTQEVIRSVPTDRAVDLYRRFRETVPFFDTEA